MCARKAVNHRCLPDQLHITIYKVLTSILTLSFFLILGVDAVSEDVDRKLSFDLPFDWEVFEDRDVTDKHRSISLVTSRGSLVGVEVFELTSVERGADINAYLKRYVASALRSDELRARGNIDFGERKRVGQLGRFVHITTQQPSDLNFLIEVYQLERKAQRVLVVFNTPLSDVDSLQSDFDTFLKSLYIHMVL